MRYFPLPLLFLLCTCGPAPEPASPASIMAIFAHPDDEMSVAPILAKYAAAGTKVHIVNTTGVRFGITGHAGIPVGDSLVDVRREELACSCRALGIAPPIHLLGEDIDSSEKNTGSLFGQFAYMDDELAVIIDSLRPELILTFDPQGNAGHPDHKLTVEAITQLFSFGMLDYLPELYYFSYSKNQADKHAGWNINYATERFHGTRISFSAEDAERYYAAIRCYRSQYSPEEMTEWIALERANTDKWLILRQAKIEPELFEGF